MEIEEKCPFCASDLTRIESWVIGKGLPSEHKEHAVMCLHCGAMGPNDLGKSGAIEMWNMRRKQFPNNEGTSE